MKVWVVDAFTDEPCKGNPAAVVVVQDFPSVSKMQSIALYMNFSETCFIKHMGAGKFYIRWFTPTVEVKLCGHATLSAAFVLKTFCGVDTKVIQFESIGGPLTVESSGVYFSLTLESDEMRENIVDERILDALGDTSVFHSVKGKADDSFLVYVYSNPLSVRNLNPNFVKLKEATANAIIVTSKGDLGYDYLLRVFAPQYGIDEDPVTGSAQVLLASYWASQFQNKTEFDVFQASPRTGRLRVSYLGKTVTVSGQVVLVSSQDIY
jgi:PhzF family phenazine biosynthesis protein